MRRKTKKKMTGKNEEEIVRFPSAYCRLVNELFGDQDGPPSHEQLEIAMPAMMEAFWQDLSFNPTYDFLMEMRAEREQGDKMDNGHTDDYSNRLKTGISAYMEWSDVVTRMADALEHLSVAQVQLALSMQGLVVDGTSIKAKHRVDCPSCALMRSAKPSSLVRLPGGTA
jgi:hypothetical protein